MVIPNSMRKDMLKCLHVSHQGTEATLRRARQTMFWPCMAVDVKHNIGNCHACKRDAPEQMKERLHSHSLPNKPWKKVGMDISPTNRATTWYSLTISPTTLSF